MYAVIGDIHGCYNTLKELVSILRRQYGDIIIFSVGDLADRGRFTPDVFELVDGEGIAFVKGNHDLMFYYGFTQPSNPFAITWTYNGSENTVKAYKQSFHLLKKHLQMVVDAPFYINLDDTLITHAGISEVHISKILSSKQIDEQKLNKFAENYFDDEHGILWNRGQLANVGKLQIVGHRGFYDFNFKENTNSVYIDTYVYMSNKLTAVIIENGKIINAISVNTVVDDLFG